MAKKKRKLNAWQKHIQATMKSHKGMGFGDMLSEAKKTYRKK